MCDYSSSNSSKNLNLKQKLNIGQLAQEYEIKPSKIWRLFNYCVDSGQFIKSEETKDFINDKEGDQFYEQNYGIGWITLGVYPERLIHFAEKLQLSMYQFCLFLSEVYERNGGSSTFGDSDLDIYTRHIGQLIHDLGLSDCQI